jgi:hypothetical protein
MTAASKLYLKDGTRSTMPWPIWQDAVLEMADVSMADMRTYVGRARVSRWYADDMAVWLAAGSVRDFVKLGKNAERLDRNEPSLRRILRPRAPR